MLWHTGLNYVSVGIGRGEVRVGVAGEKGGSGKGWALIVAQCQ